MQSQGANPELRWELGSRLPNRPCLFEILDPPLISFILRPAVGLVRAQCALVKTLDHDDCLTMLNEGNSL